MAIETAQPEIVLTQIKVFESERPKFVIQHQVWDLNLYLVWKFITFMLLAFESGRL